MSCVFIILMNKMAKIRGLYAVLNHVPERLHQVANKSGQCMSRKVSLAVADGVATDHDHLARKAKLDVESLHQGGLSARMRKTLEIRKDIPGVCFFADNLGKLK